MEGMDLTTSVASVGSVAPVAPGGAPPAGPSPGHRSAPLTPRALGDYGERLAVRYLTEQGVAILDRNWRCVRGELDIVARDGRELVVCEVKTRSGEGFGAPFEAVTWRKQRRLRQLGGLWRDEHPEEAAGPLRIDVISILRPPGRPARVEHLRGVC